MKTRLRRDRGTSTLAAALVVSAACGLAGARAAESRMPHHPGKITYVDGATQKVVAVEDASSVPESLRFAETPSGPVPVVKVVMQRNGQYSEILEYGPDGQLLRTTI